MKVRRGILVFLWILSLIGISFYGGAVSYGLFFGVTMIPVISLIYLLCVYARFKIYQETSRRNIVCGQPEPYFFTLENEDYFVYTSVSVRMHSDFSYVEESFDQVEYELFPRQSSTFETRIVCKYRGEYEIGVKEVAVRDLFGLFCLRYPVSGQIKAAVAPRVVPLSRLRSIYDLPAFLTRETSGSTDADILVRDYVEGDSLKQVHWKATARQQKLKVRIFTGQESQGISIFCDTRRYSEDRREYLPLENKLLEVFLAVGYYFAERNRAFAAYYGQRGNRDAVEGMGAFDAFYKRVSDIVFDPREDMGAQLARAVQSGEALGGLLFCVLHELTPEVLKLTERLTAGGAAVVLYVVTDREPEPYLKQAAARRRIAVIPVEAELEGRL